MNYTLQVHGERTFYQVPPGLYELMSDISREVLRDQPDQLYGYIANYMDTLLKLRTNMKTALEVVDDVIAENRELFAYVDSLGMSWEEAGKNARVIQRAYRKFRARINLQKKIRAKKEEQLGKVPFLELSPSFIEYFDSLGIDYATATDASIKIQAAFKTFIARKEMSAMKKCSTHTIDMIAPPVDIPLVLEKPTTRDSKLLVYEESPSPSINSGWYKPPSVEAVKDKKSVTSSTSDRLVKKRDFKRDSKLQVYEHSPKLSIDSGWYSSQTKSTDVSLDATQLRLLKRMSFLEQEEDVPAKPSRTTSIPTLETPLPTYFDADQSKVPMISETGQLDNLEEDVVTLFSIDTFKVSKDIVGSASSDHSRKEGFEKLPSLNELGKKSSKTESETVKELFGIIEKKSSEADRTSTQSRHSTLTRNQESDGDQAIPSTRPSQISQKKTTT